MADTVTTTLDMPHAQRIGASPYGFLMGSVNITAYSQTKVELTALTGQFLAAPRVTNAGVSSNGYLMRWDPTAKAFRAYMAAGSSANPTITTVTNAGTAAANGIYNNSGTLTQPAGTAGIVGIVAGAFTGTAGAEVGNGVNVGSFDFHAIGQMG